MLQLSPTHFERMLSALDVACRKQNSLPEYLVENPLSIGQSAFKFLGPCVYLIATKERGSDIRYVKIGVAKKLNKRLASIRSCLPLEIKKVLYFCTVRCGKALALEKKILEASKSYKCQGEWLMFEAEDDMEQWLNSACVEVELFLKEQSNWFFYDPNESENHAVDRFLQKIKQETGPYAVVG